MCHVIEVHNLVQAQVSMHERVLRPLPIPQMVVSRSSLIWSQHQTQIKRTSSVSHADLPAKPHVGQQWSVASSQHAQVKRAGRKVKLCANRNRRSVACMGHTQALSHVSETLDRYTYTHTYIYAYTHYVYIYIYI